MLPLVAKVTATAPTSPPTIPPTIPATASLLSIIKQWVILLNSASLGSIETLTVVLTGVLLKMQWIKRVHQNWYLYTGFFSPSLP